MYRRIALLLGLYLIVSSARATEPSSVDFDREIRPILSDHCFACHGPDEAAREAGLRLDVREAALGEADSGLATIVPHEPEESELVARILSEDESIRMPPPEAKLNLSPEQRQRLVDWIREGAEYEQHWAFVAPQRPDLPPTKRSEWSANPIDRFVLARLELEQLSPTDSADQYRLARRVHLDLWGIPPTPAAADAFVADPHPNAYEQLVDRLLASPAFGERLTWEWLDASRYADSNGYQGDRERTMWPWRDWVISAFNRGMPFDQFTVWQLAGDLLPGSTHEQQLATGFCRNYMINGEGGRIPEENRIDYVMDQTETLGTIWLGLTFNCCRCHDHKFDPLLRKDYYSTFAFFNQTPIDGGGGDPQTPPVLEVASADQSRTLEHLATRIASQHEQLAKLESQLFPVQSEMPQPELLQKPVAKRSMSDWETIRKELPGKTDEYVRQVDDLTTSLRRRSQTQSAIPKVMVMQDQKQRRPTFMLEVGLYNKPQDPVETAIPEVFQVDNLPAEANRRDLAEWVVRSENPLTARVTVNRIWQQFFGVGLVKTADDFGTQGERPSHSALLDWLAVEFQQSGWDVKALCRLIVTSETYQQSSRLTSDVLARDPENRLLARGTRVRLPSWMIRDQALAVSGLLVSEIGGAPVFPYQPAGVWEETTFGKKSYQQGSGADLYRRSLYTFWRRIVAPTGFFDTASRQICTVTPSRTNSPLHALTTFNDVTYVEAARVLAEEILRSDPHAPDDELIRTAFRRILIRPPSAQEVDVLLSGLRRAEQMFSSDPNAAAEFASVGEYPVQQDLPTAKLAALAATCNLILNLDEAVTKE